MLPSRTAVTKRPDAGHRCGGARRPDRSADGQPAARAPSELKTRPTLTVPDFRPVLVSGPPASSELNLPAWNPYVSTRPCWHFGRCGHSGGPPSTVAAPEHLAASSERVLT